MIEETSYYVENGQVTGPFPWHRILELARTGVIRADTQVWIESMREWVAFASVDPDANPPSVPPSTPDADVLGTALRGSPDLPAYQPFDISQHDGWTELPVSPWRRYGGRMLDTLLNAMIGGVLLAIVFYSIAPLSADRFFGAIEESATGLWDVMLGTLVSAVIGAFFVGMTGSSIGKLIFGIRVLSPSGETIGIGAGLMRELRVLVFGLGLGFPIISVVTMIRAFFRLKDLGVTSWDKGRHVVLYRPAGRKQTILNVIGVVLFALVIVSFTALDESL